MGIQGLKERLGRPCAMVFLIVTALVIVSLACREQTSPRLVVYASQDQVYAEPILRHFTERTGIPAHAIYDGEAVKTVGLANRLLAEREHPLADIFWSNDELRTRQLAAAGVFRETNGWVSFGQRSRVWVVRTQSWTQLPKIPSLLELTNSEWRGKVALASPLFGSTATHFCVLRQRWGDAAWKGWCEALSRNDPIIVEGNSMVVRLVSGGRALLGLTDSDDVAAGQREGWPVRDFPLGSDVWQMPNTVGIIRGTRRSMEAQQLLEHLRSAETLRLLQAAGALEPASEIDKPPAPVDWEALIRELPSTTAFLRNTLLR